MKINKAVSKRIRKTGEGVNFIGNAAVVANDGEEKGDSSTASVTSRQRIMQRSGRTVLSEEAGRKSDLKQKERSWWSLLPRFDVLVAWGSEDPCTR